MNTFIVFFAKVNMWVLKLERQKYKGFRSHESSATHKEAVEVIVSLRQQGISVSNSLGNMLPKK